jgi:hypothetical protein
MRPLVVTAVALALLIPILLTGGFVVRGFIRGSFHSEDQAREARALAFMSLRMQVDEETGVRGFIVTHDPLYLEPCRSARATLPRTLAQLTAALSAMRLPDAVAAAGDAQATNDRWNRTELRSAFEAEKRVADTLQEAFVLKSLPSLAGVSFSATYVPATDESNVGGDWYDCVQLSRDRVLFVIGDVAGHGLDAAVAMNNARQELISAAVFDVDPGELLGRVNAELLRQRARIVTAACDYADARSFEFTYATAGHPPPLLVEPGRTPRMLHCGGVPLGVLDGATYPTYTVQSVPGAVLVLYTDGALEHSRDVLAGEMLLVDAAARSVGSGGNDIAGRIRDSIFTERRVGDDVAIMTVAFTRADTVRDGRSVTAREAGSEIVSRRTNA